MCLGQNSINNYVYAKIKAFKKYTFKMYTGTGINIASRNEMWNESM